jgi:hypothetical protein
MSALIMVDLDRVHPVFDGRWHRVRLHRLPQPVSANSASTWQVSLPTS